MTLSLIEQARALMQSKAPAALALAILPLAESAQAAVLASDLQVNYSGAYYYNASGYTGNQVQGASVHNTVNPDGSPKLYGSVAATSQQFYDNNLGLHPETGEPWYFGNYTGVALVWGGIVTNPVQAGDYLRIHYDFTALVNGVEGSKGSYRLYSRLENWDLSQTNSLGSTLLQDTPDSPEYSLTGDINTDSLQEWQAGDGPYYWQIALVLDSQAYAWNQTYNGIRTFLSPGLALTVPGNSLDISYLNINDNQGTDLPLPGSLLLTLGGLATLAGVRRRAAQR